MTSELAKPSTPFWPSGRCRLATRFAWGENRRTRHITVEIADLIGAGYLSAGQALYSSPGKSGGFSGRILSDGRIEVEGQLFDSPSSAGSFVSKRSTNGWDFWRLEPDGRRPLKDMRTEYLKVVSPEEADEDDANPGGRE